MILNALLVGCGGFVGAALRYICSQLLGAVPTGAFPFATFAINFIGSFLIGVMSVLLPAIFSDSKQPLLFVSTGFTTFSTFSLETFGLLEQARYAMAGLYAFGSVAVCVLGVCLGRMITRAALGQS